MLVSKTENRWVAQELTKVEYLCSDDDQLFRAECGRDVYLTSCSTQHAEDGAQNDCPECQRRESGIIGRRYRLFAHASMAFPTLQGYVWNEGSLLLPFHP